MREERLSLNPGEDSREPSGAAWGDKKPAAEATGGALRVIARLGIMRLSFSACAPAVAAACKNRDAACGYHSAKYCAQYSLSLHQSLPQYPRASCRNLTQPELLPAICS